LGIIDRLRRLMAAPADPVRVQSVEERYGAAMREQRYTEAFRIARAAAERGHVRMMGCLGMLYAGGVGVEKDEVEGLLWLRQAASGGHADSQVIMAHCYARGIRLPKNDDEAAYWTFQAAAQGHPVARDWLVEIVLTKPHLVGKHFSWSDVAEVRARPTNPAATGRIHGPPDGLFGESNLD
jgi:TPR repeat protein